MGVAITSLDHVGFYVTDLDATRRFYVDVLGMREVARPASFTFPGAWFKSGDAAIHVFVERVPGRVAATQQPAPEGEELEHGFWVHASLEVVDVHAAHRELARHEVEVVGGPHARSDGVHQIYVRDPDGYMVELFSRGHSAADIDG